ncbi:metallohydrolase [Glaciecola sp. MF2-115]|uniref:metallohydrolase n=1 Tax=Glaciecola sp. MF2-115 TaxID=3384827 RepID=UPI0039A3512B
MVAKITYFPVGNGDMTLLTTQNANCILIDCNIRKSDELPDVVSQLREKLTRDSDGRLFIDIFIWSHPDEDHCKGIKEHFHLGKAEDWNEKSDLIFINEIWSSPIVYRRASKNKATNGGHVLCDDAKALNTEVKRRVKLYRDEKNLTIGNRVIILGNDEDGKTDDIQDIVMQLDTETSIINGVTDSSFNAMLLGPSQISELDEDEDKLGKNHSSVIFNYKLSSGEVSARFLSGGDAEVVCWEHLYERLKKDNSLEHLEYDVLQSPHHCSWRSISHDSLSKAKEDGTDAKVSDTAMNALKNAKANAIIISSSNTILDDDNNPPAFKAKQEYTKIVDGVSGSFKCVADHRKNGDNVPLEIEISDDGILIKAIATLATSKRATASAVNRDGGDGYA